MYFILYWNSGFMYELRMRGIQHIFIKLPLNIFLYKELLHDFLRGGFLFILMNFIPSSYILFLLKCDFEEIKSLMF
jgi:hypothetical protein